MKEEPVTNPFGPLQDLVSKKSTKPCPECTEALDETRRAEEKALQQAKEQAAKAEQQEKKALEIYKSQATTIEKHIIEAGDDAELRAELTTMLKNCKLLWANKVEQSITRTNNVPPAKPQKTTKMHKALVDKKQKLELLCERAEILHAQELAKSGKDAEKTKESGKQCEEWRGISAKMGNIVKMFETKVLKELGGVEEDVSAAWTQALELIQRA